MIQRLNDKGDYSAKDIHTVIPYDLYFKRAKIVRIRSSQSNQSEPISKQTNDISLTEGPERELANLEQLNSNQHPIFKESCITRISDC